MRYHSRPDAAFMVALLSNFNRFLKNDKRSS
jgi:hypothetical protein